MISIREKIKEKVNSTFIFLDKDDNSIEIADESDFTVNDILVENKLIKLKKIEDTLYNGDIKLKNISIDSLSSIDTSKYEVLEKMENLTIYKYSSKERQSNQNLVYQYFYDEFNITDYDNAYVILFLGRVGDGKTTAINALFNIIKGIKLKDNYRFILIDRPNKISELPKYDGVHLYYIKRL